MKDYMGERVVLAEDTPYAGYDRARWCLEFVDRYGGIDGSHHKQWVLDQVARIALGAPVTIKLAEWGEDGKVTYSEYRIAVGDSGDYDAWVAAREAEDYPWDPGIAP